MQTLKMGYIYPHPDDELFGPAAVIYDLICEGQEVHILTLTRGAQQGKALSPVSASGRWVAQDSMKC